MALVEYQCYVCDSQIRLPEQAPDLIDRCLALSGWKRSKLGEVCPRCFHAMYEELIWNI